MVNSSNLLNVGNWLSLYHYQVESAVQERDGRQQHAVAMIGTIQLSILAGQWRNVEPNFTTYGLTTLPMFSSIYKVFGSLIEQFIDRNDDSLGSRIHITLEAFSDLVLEHTPKIVQLSIAVSIVALAALGHTQMALFNFATMALSYIKRNGYLPSFIDKFLTPIAELSSLVAPFFLSMTIVGKALTSIYLLARIYQYIICSPIGTYLMGSHTPSLSSSHVVSEDKTIANYTREEIEQIVSSENNLLRVNYSSIYSEHVANLLPPEMDGDILEHKEEYFESLERKIEEKGVELNDFQKQGLENLKIGLIEGRVGDKRPIHFTQFQKTLTALIYSLLQEEVDFERKIQELSEIGNNCNEGWLRETLFLLKPEAQNADWAVHYELAKLRSQFVHEQLPRLQQTFERNNLHSMSFEELMGGSLNAHLAANVAQGVLWPWFRTYEGEQYFQTFGTDPLSSYLIGQIDTEQRVLDSRLALFTVTLLLSQIHPMANIYWVIFAEFIDSNTLQNFYRQPELLVDTIYRAIRPSYSVEGEVNRRIEWDAITSWISDISERLDGKIDFLDEESENGFNPTWVRKDLQEQPALTREAVRLLLWDLGILEPVDQTAVSDPAIPAADPLSNSQASLA